jgi:hypothetical protein
LREETRSWSAAVYTRLVLAEICVALLQRERKIQVGQLLRNSWFLLTWLPLARRRARRLLAGVLQSEQFDGSGIIAVRAKLALGTIEIRTRRGARDGVRLLNDARSAAQALGVDFYLNRIDKILARYSPPEATASSVDAKGRAGAVAGGVSQGVADGYER